MTDRPNLLEDMRNFNINGINQATFKNLEQFLNDKQNEDALSENKVKATSNILVSILAYVRAIYAYSKARLAQ